MKQLNHTRKLVACSVFIAIGIMMPVVFHAFGILGKVFLPMHIPVLIAGLVFGGYAGLWIGVLTSVLSSILTGMPPIIPILPVMAVELAIYGAVGGYLYHSRCWNLPVSLLAAMFTGRLAAILMVCGMVGLLGINLNPVAYITGVVVIGSPGIAIQLILVPLMVKRLEIMFAKNRILGVVDG